MFHMHAYLVRTAGFQFALNEGHISKSFQHFIMRDGFLAIFPIGIGIEYFAEALVTADMCARWCRLSLATSPQTKAI